MKEAGTDLGGWLERTLRAHPKRLALAEKTRYRLLPVTYGALAERVERWRALFHARGLRHGDRLLLMGPNSIDWAAAWMDCARSGLVAVPLDPQTSESMLRAVLEQTRPSLIVADRLLEGDPAKELLFADLPSVLAQAPRQPPTPPAVAATDLLEIVYTSGTTGVPKGVMLTHGNVLANLEGLLDEVSLPFPMRFISTLPLSHMLEQVLGLLFPLSQGSCVIYPNTLWPSKLVGMIRAHGVHAMITTPGLMAAMKEILEQGDTSPRRALGWRLRLLGVGGASLPRELERWWSARGVRVVQGYGLTEAAPLVALNTPLRKRRGSLGRPLRKARIKLAEDGEILVKGENASPGYYGKPMETAALYTADGWLRTGDIGALENGWLYFRGRKKDVIALPGGLKVHPEDVEAALDLEPGVKGSCVVGRRDKVWAVLLLEPGTSAEAAARAANARLMPHQRVAGVTSWPLPDFPRTRMGKIRKFEVLSRLDDAETGKPGSATAAGGRVAALVARALGAGGVEPSAKLGDLGMDSLARVGLLSSLSQELGVDLEETAVSGDTTVAALQALVESKERQPRARMPRWQFARPAALLRPALRWLPEKIALAFARPECSGLERLRGVKGPVILAVNHESAWDAAVVRRFLPRPLRKTAIPALPDFFGFAPGDWPRRAAYRAMGLFIGECYAGYPFGPAVGTERSLETTGRLIDRGYSVMIFPEGGRTPDGKIQPFMGGVGVLAREMKVPVIPVRVRGMREILPFPRFLIPKRGGHARVTFGAPMRLDPGLSESDAAREIQRAVEALA